MIASIAFKNFRALRDAHLSLGKFNLVIGTNGSGKTSLIDAIARLHALARLPLGDTSAESRKETAEIQFSFHPPFETQVATLACISDTRCDLLRLTGQTSVSWTDSPLRQGLLGIRTYALDHRAMIEGEAAPLPTTTLAPDGRNLRSVLRTLAHAHPEKLAAIQHALLASFTEYKEMEVWVDDRGAPHVSLKLQDRSDTVSLAELSQGTLYALALLAITHNPARASLVAMEEVDRGFHPRLLRPILDILYELSHPLAGTGTQVIATTHSPHLLDLFHDHPEEVILASKRGSVAHFRSLADVEDLSEMLAGEGSLGDLWYTGVLGSVPDERHG